MDGIERADFIERVGYHPNYVSPDPQPQTAAPPLPQPDLRILPDSPPQSTTSRYGVPNSPASIAPCSRQLDQDCLGLADLPSRIEWDDRVSSIDTRARRGTWRIEDSSDEEEVNATYGSLVAASGLPVRWKEAPIAIRKFIDDTSGEEKTAIQTGVKHVTAGKEEVHVHVWKSEALLMTVMQNARAIEMEVNPSKTQLLCITSAINYQVRSYIYSDGQKLLSGDTLKLLDYTMCRRPNSDQHITDIRRKYDIRAWILRNLRQAGVPPQRLVLVYCSLIRPVLEYPSVVFHSGLTEEASDRLERLQSASLRSIFGQGMSYSASLEQSGLTTLKERRNELLLNFANRAAGSERFSTAWFPETDETNYELRRTLKYKQELALRDRLLCAPIFKMRQLLNQTSTLCISVDEFWYHFMT